MRWTVPRYAKHVTCVEVPSQLASEFDGLVMHRGLGFRFVHADPWPCRSARLNNDRINLTTSELEGRIGAALASFTVEGFGVEALGAVERAEVDARASAIKARVEPFGPCASR